MIDGFRHPRADPKISRDTIFRLYLGELRETQRLSSAAPTTRFGAKHLASASLH